MKALHPSRGTRLPAGFTMIELIAVLAVMAILISLAGSSAYVRLRQGYRDQEKANLDALAGALTNVARSTRYIPSSNTWGATLAAQLVLAEVKVTNNISGNNRSFLVDPGINVTLPYTQTGTGIGSFTTTGGGGTAPANLRFIFLSSLADPIPSLTGITFDTIWNTADDALPTGWPSTWKGAGADLKIRRVDLRTLLVRLVLSNLDASNDARWQIDGASGVLILPASTQKVAWYFDGSFVSLYDSTGTLFAREVLHSDTSFVYQYNQWGRHLTSNGLGPTGDFGQKIDSFLATAAVPIGSSRFGADQQAVVDEMFAFLRSYGLWGNAGFPVGGSTSAQQVPEMRQLNDCQARLDHFSYNLAK